MKERGWALIEIVGKRKHAGYVTEERIAGVMMLRIDVPDVTSEDRDAVYKSYFYAGQAIFGIEGCSEDEARAWELDRRLPNVPPQPLELPAGSFRDERDHSEDDTVPPGSHPGEEEEAFIGGGARG